ncbi:hypothetical protein ACCQ13_14935 [Xanthomonas sp. NCPPB 1638]|uniref:hypothetical protein n=1 Tax=Xanthomonas TaxID=338 RepID=UPI001331287C|nr:hypothetical protein [Xanthomonas cucurbitae]
MRSADTQLPLGIKPKPTVDDWRQAAEKCAEQYPGDQRRLNYYLDGLEKAENMEKSA